MSALKRKKPPRRKLKKQHTQRSIIEKNEFKIEIDIKLKRSKNRYEQQARALQRAAAAPILKQCFVYIRQHTDAYQ